MFKILRYSIFIVFAKVGFITVFLGYTAYILYNIVLPAYFFDAFYTNPSAFAGLKFLPVFLVFSALIIILVSAALYAYIEIGRYKQQVKFLTEERVLFEVRLPENSRYSIESMEALFETISYGSGEGLWFPVWWSGSKRPLYSFEIVSKGGVVSFLVNTRAVLFESIKSAILAYYPNAQVIEVDEYVYNFEYNEDTQGLFSFEWKFKSNDALPIKTYVEFNLDKNIISGPSGTETILDQQSKLLVEPLSAMYDLLGSIKNDEQIWIQYVFRLQKYKKAKEDVAENPLEEGFWDKKSLPEEIKIALVELEEKIKKAKEDEETLVLSNSEKRLQTVGPRLAEKQPIEVGIRVIYTAGTENFNPPKRLAALTGIYRLTNTEDNALIPHGTLLTDVSEVPALEPPRKDKEAEKKLLLQLYRDRMFWFAPAVSSYQPSDEKIITGKLGPPSKQRISTVMSTETFATVCHFPTRYIRTPSINRADSKRIDPPENLPV